MRPCRPAFMHVHSPWAQWCRQRALELNSDTVTSETNSWSILTQINGFSDCGGPSGFARMSEMRWWRHASVSRGKVAVRLLTVSCPPHLLLKIIMFICIFGCKSKNYLKLSIRRVFNSKKCKVWKKNVMFELKETRLHGIIIRGLLFPAIFTLFVQQKQ